MLKVKKSIYLELVGSALLCGIVSLFSVFYLCSIIAELSLALSQQHIVKNLPNVELETVVEEEVEKNEEIIEEKAPAFVLSAEDRELLAKLLYCEGRGESLECQKAIVSVVLNRLKSGKWGDSLSSVVYAKGQFEPALNGLIDKAKPNEKQYEAIDYVVENGATVPEWVLFFRASYHFNWKGYTAYCNIDNTYFGGMK